MAVQCAVIVLLLSFVMAALLKSKRKKWALATAPLCVVPMANFIMELIFDLFLQQKLDFFVCASVIFIALIASCTWIGFCAAAVLKKKKTKVYYFFGTIAFNVILSLILLIHYYQILYAV